MEYGIFVDDIGAPPADPREVCRTSLRSILPPGAVRALYFGTEFCAELLPDAAKVSRLCAHAGSLGVEAVLLTPIAAPAGLERVKRLLNDVTNAGNTPEVVFNDWGVGHLLRDSFPGLRRRAGRLINRGLRDPRLMEKETAPCCVPGDRAIRLRSLLAKLGTSALETDPDLEGGYLGDGTEGLQRVLYLPFSFAASSRNCLVKAAALPSPDGCFTRGLGTTCSAACRGKEQRIERTDTTLTLWRSGNTVFFEVPQARAESLIRQADRIVLQQRPTP